MSANTVLDLPRVYIIRMAVFLVLVGIIATVLYPTIREAFLHNPGLNGTILGILFLGILYAFRMVWRLFPEVNWVNNFRIADPGLEVPYTPVLLAPMATMLRDRRGPTVLSPQSMRTMLESIALRLDESRDISRYLIGLLIFLGLLGTFWGLLETVQSVTTAIRSLDVSTQSGSVFEELKRGLEAPLQGMGTSFSSSLFGLAGSLVLGFLDLQASQAQNRFYTDLEDWLSSITDLEAGDQAAASVPNFLRLDMKELRQGIARMNQTLDEALTDQAGSGSDGDTEALSRLADAVENLVRQMREEQKIVRQWVQAQSEQTADLRRILSRLPSEQPQRPPLGSPAPLSRQNLRPASRSTKDE
ncbi:MAG: flagellar motor protein MotA [Hyphomicrobiales bacterium]